MQVFGKTISYWYEKYGGTLYGCLVFILFLFIIKPEFYSYKELIQEFPSIGMCAFGFMLTFLGIILQGDSSTIKYMKSRKTLYDKFIFYNILYIFLIHQALRNILIFLFSRPIKYFISLIISSF